jgi:hypothetical protein
MIRNRLFAASIALLVAALAALLPASATAAELQQLPHAKGLVVHEWGVFSVNEDVEFANADLRAEWDKLPAFVHGHIKGRVVPQHWGAVEARRRPIVFFHAKEPALVSVKIDFPGGLAGVWYPATMSPAVYGMNPQPAAGNSLQWELGIKQPPGGWRPKAPAPPEVTDKHWFARVRQVKSDEIFARYSPNNQDVERERFLYYDGIFPQGKWLKIEVEKDRVSLTSRVKHPVFDVTVVDRRGEGKVRVGRVARVEAGETVKGVKFENTDESRFASEASETLLKQLAGAGLNEDEAKSLVDLWRKEFFETPGLNLFYRIPQTEYDRLLPLTITPAPVSVVRVGLVHHGHLEPDFAERVLELVKKLDSPKFAEREAATKKLIATGPAALVQLQKILQSKDLSVDVRERVETLVKKWSAQSGFDAEEQLRR